MDCQLTVLMAVHNGAPFLSTAIDSILSQTYRDFRFLIVDDASTDDTREIVRSYDDRRIELLCLEHNVGQTAALNTGLRRITTPWVARMDADDYSAPTRLEEQMRALDLDKSLSCVGTFAWAFRQHPRVVDLIMTNPVSHEEIKRALLRGSSIIHGSIVVNRKALVDVGGYNERYRYCADLELYDRLFIKHVAANIPRPLLGFRLHNGQGSRTKLAVEEAIDIFSRRLSADGYSRDERSVIRASLSVAYLQRARHLRAEGEYFGLLTDVLSGFCLSPETFVSQSLRFFVVDRLPGTVRATLKRVLIRGSNVRDDESQ